MTAEGLTNVKRARSEGCIETGVRDLPHEQAAASPQRSRLAETNWDLFRLFFSVAQSGSVNRAARALGMSQPTLSRRLKELERNVGAPLFFRVSSGVKLTQEGEELHRSAEEMVRSFEAFHRDLSLRVGDRSTAVKISATEGLTKHWLLPRVKKLRALNAQIRLEINSTVEQQNLAASDLDLVIRIGHPGDNELVGRRVGTIAFGLFASAGYVEEHGAPKTLDDLVDHDLIGRPVDYVEAHRARTGPIKLLNAFNAAQNARNTLNLMPVANHFAATAEGLGLAFLPIPFAVAEGLVRVLPEETAILDLWLLRRRETDLRRMTRQVWRFLETEFANTKSWFAAHKTTQKRLHQVA
ncbi:LysR family transcriptional regulator [Bradyrhizobium sp. CCBAU 51627]|uniref:LysR family transcriptional regulator n=1 Tax=Bradyrhizobium sp. CCBAU 51627 TaxID=1325088 RepID=UPI002304FCBB|nr:LysR family transcriptional regulator [Bradyrhizobium sp. CCBAU 51627]